MAKGLISLLKGSLSNLNDLRYFGDVVVYASNDLGGKFIEFFTDDEFTHCALRTGKYKAEGARIKWGNLIPLKKKQGIIRPHNLENPLNEYETYLILRHKKINIFKRVRIKKIYDKMEIRDYDSALFLRKAFKHAIRKTKRIFGYNDNERSYSLDLSKEGSYLCGSQTDYPLFKVSLGSKEHWSQKEPHHFLKDKNYEIIEKGFRTIEGKWIIRKIKKPNKFKDFIFRILPFYKSPQLEEPKKQLV